MKILILAIIFIFIFSCEEGGESPGDLLTRSTTNNSSVVDPGFSKIFITPNQIVGSGDDSGLTNGKVSFDQFCQKEADTLGYKGTYKAIISAGNNRRACFSAFCGKRGTAENIDWPMLPNREYRLASDGTTVVGTTNAGGVFAFPLETYLGDSGLYFWSGFNATTKDWTEANDNCDNFTSTNPATDSMNAKLANPDVLDANILAHPDSAPPSSCAHSNHVLCVEYYAPKDVADPAGDYGIMFTTQELVDGTGSAAGDGSGSGLSDFDALCATEASDLGLSGTFKAVVGVGSTRRACTSAFCDNRYYSENIDWPLGLEKEYRRLDKKTVIGTTNKGGVFTFPLTNSISDYTETVWGGFNSGKNWTADGNNCSGLTSTGHAMTVMTVDDATSGLLNDGTTANCNTLKPILCATSFASRPSQNSYRRIFLTTNTYQGGNGFTGTNGIVDTDAICQNEAKNIGDLRVETFKAMIAGMLNSTITQRTACSTAYCGSGGTGTNWVLDASTQYRRVDGTVIGTTNAQAIFDFPLNNPLSNEDVQVWLGFYSTWATGASLEKSCLQFTNKGTAEGNIGYANRTDFFPVGGDTSTVRCDQYRKFVCVEQTRN